MVLADAIIVLWVFLALLVGFVAFFALLLIGAIRLAGALFHLLIGQWFVSDGEPSRDHMRSRPVCTRSGCRYENLPTARFCARCGQRLVE